MRVVFSGPARADLQAVFSFIEIDNPRAARRVVNEVLAAIANLSAMPNRARPGLDGSRELVLPRIGYIALYRVDGEVIYILRIRHGRQNTAT